MIRISATADIHFRPQRAAEVFASLTTLERESREREVDLIAISGDLFSAAVLATGNAQYPDFVERIRRLADVAPVVMVYGTPSHDIAGCLDVFTQLKTRNTITVLQPGSPYFLADDGHIEGDEWSEDSPVSRGTAVLQIFGIPEPSKSWLLTGRPAMGKEQSDEAMRVAMRELLLGYAAQRKQHPDIPCLVLYHGQIRGATMDNGQVVENAIGRDDLAMIGADYYALGDIHAPQQIGDLPMYYPGSVYPIDWGETHRCGFNVVTIPTAQHETDRPESWTPRDGWAHCVERVHFPHPQQVKITGPILELYAAGRESVKGKRVWVEIDAMRDDTPSDDAIETIRKDLEYQGAVEGSKVTLKIQNTETVRAGEITKASTLLEKVLIYAENSSQTIADTVLEKADELAGGRAQTGYAEGAHIRLRKLILRGAIGIWKGQGLDEITVNLDEYDPGIIGLFWANGSGKTTLIENMHPWPCLLTRGGKLADHFRLRDSFRDLYFIDERSGDEYRALIQINGTSKAGDAEYLLYCNGTPVTNGRKDPYVEAINELFGGLDLYLRSAFVSQKDAGLADATKGERKAILVELSGLDYLQEYAAQAKDAAKLITDELAADAGWITATEEQLSALPDLTESKCTKDGLLADESEKAVFLGNIVNSRRDEHDMLSAKVEADRLLRQQRDDLNTRDGKLTAEQVEITAEREGWEDAAAGREDAEARVAKWEGLEDERKKLEATKAQKSAAQTEALMAYTAVRTTYESVRRELEEDKHVAETDLADLGRDRKKALAAKELLGELLDAPRHDTCPECGAGLPWAADEQSQRHARQRQLESNQTAIWEIDKKSPDAQGAVEIPAKALRSLIEPTEPKAQKFTEDERLQRIAADQDYLEIDDSRDVIANAAEAAVHIKELDRRLTTAGVERVEIAWKLAEVVAKIDDEILRKFNDSKWTLQAAQEEHANARESLAALTAQADAITRQIDDLRQKAVDLQARKSAVTTKRRDADEWTWLQKACGPDGIQALELDALAPSIEEVANRLLQAAYGPRFSIRFETTRMDSTGKRQLETFDIWITDSEHGDEQELATLSGGESVWIKRALYDAFGIIRARNTGLKFLTVMQDESDGALDPERREQYARMLEAAHVESGRYHTIMITHSAEVQAMLSQRIEVTAPEGAI